MAFLDQDVAVGEVPMVVDPGAGDEANGRAGQSGPAVGVVDPADERVAQAQRREANRSENGGGDVPIEAYME